VRKAICSGSFDPVTKGHLDIIERASRMFDEIVVCVFYNPGKDKSLFTPKERVEMLKTAVCHLDNVKVTCYDGLLADFCEMEGAQFIVRGLRAFTDFEYEFQRALLLKKINEKLETVFIMTNASYSYISSSGVRELLAFGGSIGQLVPPGVGRQIRAFMKAKNSDSEK